MKTRLYGQQLYDVFYRDKTDYSLRWMFPEGVPGRKIYVAVNVPRHEANQLLMESKEPLEMERAS